MSPQQQVDDRNMNAIRRSIAVFGVLAAISTMSVRAQNLFCGHDNFYKSELTFPNQYQMTVAGNLFVPKNLSRSGDRAAIVIGYPMDAVKEQSANYQIS